MSRAAWEDWEREIQDRWGLDSTICSGNKFHDPGDAVDHTNPQDSSFRLEVDCKDTLGKSYSLSKPCLALWTRQAEEKGKRFVLALRFRERDHPRTRHQEYVVMPVADYEELLEGIRELRATRVVDRTWDD